MKDLYDAYPNLCFVVQNRFSDSIRRGRACEMRRLTSNAEPQPGLRRLPAFHGEIT